MDSNSLVSGQIPRAARGLRVLLVDHDTASLMYVASVLEEQRYKVRTTELATVALSMIQEEEQQFDLVMAGTNMPEMDIFTFLKCILLKRDIPIILMSIGANEDMARKALSEGACFFLEKPIRMQDLINVWQHVYRRRRVLQGMEIQREDTEKLSICRRDVFDKGINQVDDDDDHVPMFVVDTSGCNKKTKGEVNLIERDCTREWEGISVERLITVESMRIHQENTEENYFIGSEIKKMDNFLKENFEHEASASRAAAGNDIDDTNDEHLATDEGEKDIEIEGEVGQEKRSPVRESQDNSTECLMSIAKEEHGDQLKRKRLADQDDERSELKENDSKTTEANKEAKRKRKKKDDDSFDKRSRMTWTSELHLKFMEAIIVLGEKKAHPKAVLEMMNVPNLTHRHVASHLQKYRERVKRIRDCHATNPPLIQSKMTGSTFKFYGGNGIPQKQAVLHDSWESPEGPMTAKPVLLEAAMKQYRPELPLGRRRLCLGSSFTLTDADSSNKLTENSQSRRASDYHKPLVECNGKLHRLDRVEGSAASAGTIDQTAKGKGEQPLGFGGYADSFIHVTTNLACPVNSAHAYHTTKELLNVCEQLDCTQELNAPQSWQNPGHFGSGQEQTVIAGFATMLDSIEYADLEAELAGFKGQLNNGDIDNFSEWLVTPPKSDAGFPHR